MPKTDKEKVIFDYSRLLGKMKEKGVTQGKIADIIGVKECTVCLKLNNKSEFKASEMISILRFLGVPVDDIALYFFCSTSFENAS